MHNPTASYAHLATQLIFDAVQMAIRDVVVPHNDSNADATTLGSHPEICDGTDGDTNVYYLDVPIGSLHYYDEKMALGMKAAIKQAINEGADEYSGPGTTVPTELGDIYHASELIFVEDLGDVRHYDWVVRVMVKQLARSSMHQGRSSMMAPPMMMASMMKKKKKKKKRDKLVDRIWNVVYRTVAAVGVVAIGGFFVYGVYQQGASSGGATVKPDL